MNLSPENIASNVVHVDFANQRSLQQPCPPDITGATYGEIVDATETFEVAQVAADCETIIDYYLGLVDKKRPRGLTEQPPDDSCPPPATMAELELRISEAYDAMASVGGVVARVLLNKLSEKGPIATDTGARLLGSFASGRIVSPEDLLNPASRYVDCPSPCAAKNIGQIADRYLRSKSIARSPDGRIIGVDQLARQRAVRDLRERGIVY